MNKRAGGLSVALVGLALALGTATVVLAQTSAEYHLEWHVVAGGGSGSSSTNYRVQGTTGQSVVGGPPASSSSFAIRSGFWVFDTRTVLYLPVVLRSRRP
jgi:hypothetical protein